MNILAKLLLTIISLPKILQLMNLAKLINEQFDIITEELFNHKPSALYEPVKHILSAKGKRIRPMLVLLAGNMFGAKPASLIKNAYGVELFHNFTLVHDDIMDKADIRRGIPTVHIKYGLNAGILSGDLMVVHALELASLKNEQVNHEMFSLMSKTAVEIYRGQQFDVDFETRNDVAEAEYVEMIRLKTAVLLACSLKIGAIGANASKAQQELIYKFGENIGIAFQIQDDYLDSFGDERVGKVIGGDICNNKKTMLFIKALEMANNEQKAVIEKWMQTSDFNQQKVDEIKAVFTESGAKDYCFNQMQAYYNKALENLNAIDAPEETKAPFKQIAEEIITRVN